MLIKCRPGERTRAESHTERFFASDHVAAVEASLLHLSAAGIVVNREGWEELLRQQRFDKYASGGFHEVIYAFLIAKCPESDDIHGDHVERLVSVTLRCSDTHYILEGSLPSERSETEAILRDDPETDPKFLGITLVSARANATYRYHCKVGRALKTTENWSGNECRLDP